MHRLDEGGGEGFGVGRLVARGRRQLGLDVEAHMMRAAVAHQVKQLGERRDADAVHAVLLRQGRGVGRPGLQPPDIVALDLGQGQRVDRRPRAGEELAVGSAGMVGVEAAVVADDQDAVLGHGEVELERRDADPKGRRERLEGVLGREATRAAMALEVEGEGVRRCRHANHESRGGDPHGCPPKSSKGELLPRSIAQRHYRIALAPCQISPIEITNTRM